VLAASNLEGRHMKTIAIKLLKIAAVVGVGMLIMRFAGPKLGERMDRMFEEASEEFPPKWMFVNINAIRENTERILEAVTSEPTGAGAEAA
jgi:hypothetical protein